MQREVKDMARLKILSVLWAGVILAGIPATARAQVDLAGFWSNPNFEDVMERIDGPAIGDFTGLPITAAGRRAGETWDAGIMSVPEHQCQDYPADYQSNSTWSFDMWKEVDPVTHDIVAWRTRLQYMAPERTIWMDGRPHPDDEAPHTWEGFSTGRWEGGALIVTTTHLKTSWLRRNGVPRRCPVLGHRRPTHPTDSAAVHGIPEREFADVERRRPSCHRGSRPVGKRGLSLLAHDT